MELTKRIIQKMAWARVHWRNLYDVLRDCKAELAKQAAEIERLKSTYFDNSMRVSIRRIQDAFDRRDRDCPHLLEDAHKLASCCMRQQTEICAGDTAIRQLEFGIDRQAEEIKALVAAVNKLQTKWSGQIDDKNNGLHTAAWAQLRICRDELAALLPDSMPRKTDPGNLYCDRCDGCGWYEGGKTIQTECEVCGGTGVLKE